jgi:MscS family membrane protein
MILARILTLVGLLLALPAAAQLENPLTPLDTSSPSATVRSFITGTKEVERAFVAYNEHKTDAGIARLREAADRLRQLFDLSEVPPPIRLSTGGRAVGQLVEIMLRLPEVPPTEIPGAPGGTGAPCRTTGSFPAPKFASPA